MRVSIKVRISLIMRRTKIVIRNCNGNSSNNSNSNDDLSFLKCLCMYICVYVCEERKKERKRNIKTEKERSLVFKGVSLK